MPTAEEEMRSRQMAAARQYAQANPGQPVQAQPATQQADDPITGFVKGIGSIFDGPPIRDQYGREWSAIDGWVDPKNPAPQAAQTGKGVVSALPKSDGKNEDSFLGGEMNIFSQLAKLLG